MNNNIPINSISSEDIYASQRVDTDANAAAKVKDAQEVNSLKALEKQKVDKAEDVEPKDAIEKEVEEEEFEAAFETVSSFIESAMKNVRFNNDSTSGKTIIKVIDKETSEIISQFPSDKIVSMAEKIKNLQQEISSASGILFDDSV